MLEAQWDASNGALDGLDELQDVHRALVEVERLGRALVVRPLVRRLDAESAPQLRQVFAHLASGRRLVVICLSRVESIDCSGLAAVISTLKRLDPGGELRLACASGEVRALLAATHLDELLPVFGDLEAAAAP